MPDAAGALLGNTDVDKPDLEFQWDFLTKCTKLINGWKSCLEIGAGPCRVTLGLLSYFYDVIDVTDIADLSVVWKFLEP